MKSKTLWILIWFVILTGGALLRVIDLNARPMHTDEAVHAHKFGALLERGDYRYDPHEFHGPTLNYLTLFSAWLRGERAYWQIEEATLRLVPAFFGTLLILTPLFFIRGLGRRTVLFGGVLIAFSPAFVYYSRYYIQETLLVFFTACFLGALWQYYVHRTLRWIIFAGCFLGLMHATKETFVFSVAAAVSAGLWVMWRQKRKPVLSPLHLAAGFFAFVSVSVLLFSSFFANPRGIIDSVSTYGIWMQRAGGQSVHIHPWYFYLDLITWIEFVEPLTWNEDGIVALALIGAVILLVNRKSKQLLPVFLAVYTIVLTVVYSVIPYKTPWCILSFLYGMALVAAFAAHRLLQECQMRFAKVVLAAVLLLFGLLSPVVQSKLLAFDYAADPVNPYVYAHTGDDVFEMTRRVKEAAYASGQGRDVAVQVIAGGDDYWPLPWYLRDFTSTGYWNHVDPSIVNAPIILAQQRLEQPILRTLYSVPKPGEKHLYLPLFEEEPFLRPGVPWQGYIRKELWDRLSEQESHDIEQPAQANVAPAEPLQIVEGADNMLKFSHQAMNSTFEIFIQHTDESYAHQAARAAFAEADRLEALLSRFLANSDVSRINVAPVGQTVVVDQEVMECLCIAQQALELTGGAFDITLSGKGRQALELFPAAGEVRRLEPVAVDLGGIGKGYAVDRMSQVLSEWSVSKALIHGGASSVLAMRPPDGKKGWPVTISDPSTGEVVLRLQLADEVLASSGLGKGLHIIDPATGNAVENARSSWVCLPKSAALADAVSTALMILPTEKIAVLQQEIARSSILVFTNRENQPEWLTAGDRFPLIP
jgi:uncharacterized protein (TIGR03663 family)